MYHALLTNRYLTSRVIPFVAVAAVALCVALVIIVVSVMTGFLEMVKSSGKTLVGDVVINRPVTGIPYYEDLIAAVEGLDEAAAASPIVESWGLMRMPYPDGTGKDTQTVQVWGIEPDSFSRVTGFADTLYWSPLDEQTLEDAREDDIRRQFENSRSDDPAMVMGMHVSIGNDRKSDGSYEPARGGYWHMPRFSVVLTMLPVVEGSLIDPTSGRFQIVNEFISGVFLIDKTRTMIPIAEAQRLLELTEQTTVDDEGEIEGTIPKRATMILVRAAEGVQPEALREAVEGAYMEFHERVRNDPAAGMRVPHRGAGITIQTWEQQQRDFIAPIEKER
ncbi:MAG: ABC transporter permease, partial [Planctomycetota bacterium]